MAEQTFRSPGFFEREIDLSAREAEPTGTPAGVIGTAERGPAFVPVTIGTWADFETRFGPLDPNQAGPYAVREYLKNKDAVTYMRVLGAGSNDTEAEMTSTRNYGIVSKAGFKLVGEVQSIGAGSSASNVGQVCFIAANHYISGAGEMMSLPEFTDNNSFPGTAAGGTVNLIRAAIFPTTGSRVVLCAATGSGLTAGGQLVAADIDRGNSITRLDPRPSEATFKTFKIVISSSAGDGWANDDGLPGCRIYTASLDPSNENYVSKVLNTNPLDFEDKQHLLYLNFAVEREIAPVVLDAADVIALCSGSAATNTIGGQSEGYGDSFGRYDTRYTTPRTPYVISQPFGGSEFNLFYFESISDGVYASDKLKISIANVRASTDENNPYGTFEVQVRQFSDQDVSKEVLETYPEVTLNPTSERFVAKIVGDYKAQYNFDSVDIDEQRILVSGKYPNMSRYVRVVMNTKVYEKEVPAASMPFGFRGIPVLKTTDTLTDDLASALLDKNQDAVGSTAAGGGVGTNRWGKRLRALGPGMSDTGAAAPGGGGTSLSGSILPPLPYRFKVTKGNVPTSGGAYVGYPAKTERVDSRLYWGTKFERCPLTSSVSNAVLNANAGSLPNATVSAYGKFQGLGKLDNLVTGSGADLFNDNKFTLARVALSTTTMTNLTGSANEHMVDAAYLRNKYPEAKNYTINDGIIAGRFTLATLIASSSIKFNRFTKFAKFTMPFYGGFDGLNILDPDVYYMNDKAASTDPGGKAGDDFTGGLGLNGTDDGTMMGAGRQNNMVFSYRKAADIMTDPMTVSINLIAIPGIRDPFISDLLAENTRNYSMAMYVMDIQQYDEDGNRLFADNPKRPDVRETVEAFEGRRVDNNFAATYFPDVFVQDDTNNRPVFVPSSVAVYGALSYNDSVAFPWFAPAGFNRGALGFVTNTETRLTSADRDDLYDARINPIANFPDGGFVIFGQKTLQINKSALDRVNVRRMLLEVKRLVVSIAELLLFEPNNSSTRARFVGQVAPVLALVQAQQGIEKFSVVMDDTNNTQDDVEQNRLNGRIVLVPTRAIEFIAIDFIITNAGVEFV